MNSQISLPILWIAGLGVSVLAVGAGWSADRKSAAVVPPDFAAPAPSATLSHSATPTEPGSGTVDIAGPTSVTFEAANRAGAALGPAECLLVNCSVFFLTVGDPGSKEIRVRLDWLFETNDYDLYVFKEPGGEAVTSSGNGVTTFEDAFFVPEPNTTYEILIVHFLAAPGDNIVGVVDLRDPPSGDPATRIGPDNSGLAFSPNGNILTAAGEAPSGLGTVRAPEARRDGEPSIRADLRGNVYPAGIRGVPAGVDVWRFGPDAFCPRFQFHHNNEFPTGDPANGYVWLGQPDGIFPNEGEGSPDAGGGDIEIAVSKPTNASTIPTLSMVSLTLANITGAASFDRGFTWTPANPVTAVAPPADRQWIEAYGDRTVYLYYRTLATLTGLVLQKSIDGGVTYAAGATLANPLGFTPGWIAVDQTPNSDGSVDVYLSSQNSSQMAVFHCVDPNPALPAPINCTGPHLVNEGMSHGHIFDVVAVDALGTVYAVWSNNKEIFYAYSTNKAKTWSEPVQVTVSASAPTPNFNIFPWVTAGDAGRIGIAWYGTFADQLEDSNGEWRAYYALVEKANSRRPKLRWRQASDQVIHVGNVSQAGFGSGSANNRNLIDFFQVAHDPRDGAALIAFAGDHNDTDGHTYYTRQIAGPGLLAKKKATEPAACPALEPLRDPEVIDFRGDAATISDTEHPAPDADILSVDYGWEREGEKLFLTVDMAVDLMPVQPLNRAYRMYFALNTQRGAMDTGSEYFIEVRTTSTNVTDVTLGGLDRRANGAYFEVRNIENIAADQKPGGPYVLGSPGPGHVRARVDVSRLTYVFQVREEHDELDPVLGPIVILDRTKGAVAAPPDGSLVIGLRGRTGQVTGLATVDLTRGGSYMILGEAGGATVAKRGGAAPGDQKGGLHSFRLVQAPPEEGTRPGVAAVSASLVARLLGDDAPPPATRELREAVRKLGITALAFGVPDGESARVRIRVFDPAGRLVRTLTDESYDSGAYRLQWDLLDERGARVAPGIYLAVMEAPGFRSTAKLVVVR